MVCDGTHLQPALAVLKADLTQGTLHRFACLSDLLDVSHWKLIHYSSDTWERKEKREEEEEREKKDQF